MFDDDDPFAGDAGPPRPAWQRYGLPLGGIVALVGVGFLAATLLKGSGPAARPHQEPHITTVMLPPPPPPPPPTPPPPTPPKQLQQTPKESLSPQKQLAAKAPKAPSPPAAAATSITGPGPGTLGLGNNGGGDCLGSACGNGDGSGGDNDAYYSGIVKTQIESAIHHDERLRFAKYQLRVKFQLDPSGRVVHATVSEFNGDADIKEEIGRVLAEVSTNDTPPAGIVSKIFTVSIVERAHG